LLPGTGSSGEVALTVTFYGEIDVVALELLLLGFGSSGDVSLTVAVLVMVPFVVGFAEMLIVAVPAGIMGVGMVVSLLLAGRAPRLTMNREGISVDSDGRHWQCAWADVVSVGAVGDMAQLPGRPVLVATLGPEAPPVGRLISSPPASLPDADMVVMIDLTEIVGDREEAIAAARNISGTKWRA